MRESREVHLLRSLKSACLRCRMVLCKGLQAGMPSCQVCILQILNIACPKIRLPLFYMLIVSDLKSHRKDHTP